MFVLVQLWIAPGQAEKFRAYEDAALAIFRGHGGRVLHVLHPDDAPDAPDEIHLLRVASRAQWDAFRADAQLGARADERAACIARTQVYFCSP